MATDIENSMAQSFLHKMINFTFRITTSSNVVTKSKEAIKTTVEKLDQQQVSIPRVNPKLSN